MLLEVKAKNMLLCLERLGRMMMGKERVLRVWAGLLNVLSSNN
jgi:hypothetical protein